MGGFQVIKCNCVRSFLVVEGYHHLVIIKENRVDEGVNQYFLVGLLPHVQLAETVQPESHKLCADFRFRQFLTGDTGFQFLFRGLQFFQTVFRGLGEDALLDGVE